MSVLLDVNTLLACEWQRHKFHAECIRWFGSLESFALCPITELSFLRISMSPAWGASFADAMTVLRWYADSPHSHHLDCDQSVASMPEVANYKDTTDSCLVHLAASHGHRLATLDDGMLRKNQSGGIAFNPLKTKL